MRYEIAGVASFQWEENDGRRGEASGFTRNIGKEGAFIECDSPPTVASTLQLVITLPSISGEYGQSFLRAVGDVRHVQLDALVPRGYGACVSFQLEPQTLTSISGRKS